MRFDDVYEEYADFVWRVLRRLGIPDSGIADAAQEVFVVVARRLDDFEGRSALRHWIAGIAVHVARHQHRTRLRRERATQDGPAPEDPDTLADRSLPTPLEALERQELVKRLYGLLDTLPAEKREVFVLAELEDMTAVEIARMLSIPVNTVYSRLRLARIAFDRALCASESERQP